MNATDGDERRDIVPSKKRELIKRSAALAQRALKDIARIDTTSALIESMDIFK